MSQNTRNSPVWVIYSKEFGAYLHHILQTLRFRDTNP